MSDKCSTVDTTENQIIVRFDSTTCWTAFHKRLGHSVFYEKNVATDLGVSLASDDPHTAFSNL